MPYGTVVTATYAHAHDPRWNPAAGSPPADLDVPGGGIFGSGTRHWLTIQTAAGYLILHLEDDNWKPILESEVDGPSSLPRAIDDRFTNLGRYGAAIRAARTVFIGSAPRLGSPNQGIEASRVQLTTPDRKRSTLVEAPRGARRPPKLSPAGPRVASAAPSNGNPDPLLPQNCDVPPERHGPNRVVRPRWSLRAATLETSPRLTVPMRSWPPGRRHR